MTEEIKLENRKTDSYRGAVRNAAREQKLLGYWRDAHQEDRKYQPTHELTKIAKNDQKRRAANRWFSGRKE